MSSRLHDPVIRAEGLGKRYRLGGGAAYRTLRDALAAGHRRSAPQGVAPGAWLWALKDVALEISRGEAVGVIGRNGSGKTTLLKVLSRITEPTEGWARIRGRVGSLLEVGTGFHPELTGRENVYLNGAVLGMRRAEIARRYGEIVAFAGVEPFMDTPVKHYSSGMFMRLGFAVAAHLLTEVLFVDEVLAVGDAAFQLKCLNTMSDLSGNGRTILFVSHNMEAVSKLCPRSVLLDGGRVRYVGPTQACIDRYLADVSEEQRRQGRGALPLADHPGRKRSLGGVVRLTSVAVTDRTGGKTWTLASGDPLTIELEYDLAGAARVQDATFMVTISNLYNNRLGTCRSHDALTEPVPLTRAGVAVCRIPRLPLVPGLYRLSLGCNTESGFSDAVYDAVVLEVTPGAYYPSGSLPRRTQGDVLFDHEWRVEEGVCLEAQVG